MRSSPSSVWHVTVCERGRSIDRVSYCVEAENIFDACHFALATHALDEKVNPNDCEVVLAEKTRIRRVLSAEMIPQ
jgi:hypothetical protein